MTSYLFGPVPSRRLGRSLGVDLVPMKTCSYDCIYCQLGRTTNKTVERNPWVPIDEVICQLKDRLSSQPDYITLSGSGEPTLHSRLDEIIGRIKQLTNIPVAVLTNGSLLSRREVRRQLLDADLVIPSLDAGSESAFRRVNRPHKDVSFQEMLEGLIGFRRQFSGAYWLEIMLLAGITDSDSEVKRLACWVDQIQPDRVQLNTVTRPPAESCARGVSPQRMAELAERFEPAGEVITPFHAESLDAASQASRQSVLELLRRRPCTLSDIAEGLPMHPNEVIKYIEELAGEELIRKTETGGRVYYEAASQ